jgi:hypothetical protein
LRAGQHAELPSYLKIVLYGVVGDDLAVLDAQDVCSI